jgi:hypothetical protein
MNYKAILPRTFMMFFILIQISCKKENTDKTETSENTAAAVVIDQNYQTNEKQTGSEKLQVKSVIHFAAKYSTPKLWQYDQDMKQASLRVVNKLTDGNVLYIIEEGDGKYNFTPFVLILDNEGKEIAKLKIKVDAKSKYNFYSPLVLLDKQGGFTLFAKKEIPVQESSENTDEAKMRNTLAKYQIDKLMFDSKYSGYKTESKSMASILLKPLLENGFSYIASADFSLKYLKGKVFVSGTAAKPNQNEIPFIAVLDNNLKLLKLNSFEGYPQTKIDNISLNDDGKFFVEGIENDAADGTYYSTYKRFVLNDELKVIADKSDKEPFESIYRGPSAPDVDEEEETVAEDSEAAAAKPEESTTVIQESEKGSVAIFYTDRSENVYYGIREKEINSSEVVFEKSNISDSIAVWKTKLVFPKNYEVPYNNSTEGFKRSNGDFVFFLYLRNEAGEQDELSVAIFVFNKEGRLTRQFQTPGYFGLTEFEMIESEGKLITAFVSNGAEYVNGEWQYPHAFRSIAFPLE